MNAYLVFVIEKSMGLFWVLIQQCCFCGVKYIYESLIPNGQSLRRIVMTQLILFTGLVIICSEYELSIKFLSTALRFGDINFYPWAVRITLCSAMILFDSLLLLYAFRIYRIYKFGLSAVKPVLFTDLALTLSICIICAGYIACSIHAKFARNISMDSPQVYSQIGRAFIQFSNFFYVPLEITGALLLRKFYKAVRNNKAGELNE